MGSIPKIVSTPIKWASKKLLHRFLLSFPDGNPQSPVACVYCPEMCRFSCPTAVVSGNDAVTPRAKMSLLYKEEKWPGQLGGDAGSGPNASQKLPYELWPIYDCTGCGRCTEYCVYQMPVSETLFEARAAYPWQGAQDALAALEDGSDPYGDLAWELGDQSLGLERAARFLSLNRTDPEGRVAVYEPKAFHFLSSQIQKGAVEFDLSKLWLEVGLAPPVLKNKPCVLGKKLLFHRSVFMSRLLGRDREVSEWASGVHDLVYPGSDGKDCIDCGGEGAYRRLFPKQAFRMAQEVWEPYADQADGILCVSERCAAHLREMFKALGQDVPVYTVLELSENIKK